MTDREDEFIHRLQLKETSMNSDTKRYYGNRGITLE